MKYFLFLTTWSWALILGACSPEKQLSKDPLRAAKYCLTNYPPITETLQVVKIIDSTKFKEAELRVEMYYDTIYKHDTTIKRIPKNILKYILQPCIDTQRTITIKIKDSAAAMVYKDNLQRAEKITDIYKVIAGLLAVLLLIFTIIRK